jgi:hypothetical protein
MRGFWGCFVGDSRFKGSGITESPTEIIVTTQLHYPVIWFPEMVIRDKARDVLPGSGYMRCIGRENERLLCGVSVSVNQQEVMECGFITRKWLRVSGGQ